MHLMFCIQMGKDKAIPRKEICRETGLNDRAVRAMIEELRAEGSWVCNDQDGKGYYYASNDNELLRQYRRDCARAMSILKRLKPMRQRVRAIQQQEENKDQITIEEILMLMEGKI